MFCSNFGIQTFSMKIIKITLFLLTFSFSAFAKDTTSVDFKRFAFGINASPDYCYRNLYSLIHSTTNLDDFEKPMLSYTGGMNLSYFITKHFAISLGVNFSQKGYRTSEFGVTTVEHPEGGIGKGRYRSNYNYIGIPLRVNFVLGKKKVRFLVSHGLTPSFLLFEKTNLKIKYYDGSKETKRGINSDHTIPFNLFHDISFGIDIKLGKKAGLKIEPTYCYGLLDSGRSVRYAENLYSYGLNIGYYIGF